MAALAGAMGFAVMGYVRLLAAVNALQDAEELELRRLTTLIVESVPGGSNAISLPSSWTYTDLPS